MLLMFFCTKNGEKNKQQTTKANIEYVSRAGI